MSDIAVSPTPQPTSLPESSAPPKTTVTENASSSITTARPERTRRKLDLNTNKRGAFSVLLGTLSKAKKEDRVRGASEAAQKRAQLEKRLQSKLARETDSVRRAEEAKRAKQDANRKEEDLAAKENLLRHRHLQLPHLAKFLLSTDKLDTDPPNARAVLASLQPPRPIRARGYESESTVFYLPVKLLPWQQELLAKRAALVKEGVTKEWEDWQDERKRGEEMIKTLRDRAEELGREKEEDVDGGEVEMKEGE